ncbi:MAG: SgcJ/EcaC family oxidoreductase, partial [Candidatus Sulfotelmatobacter sp.]
MRIAVCFLLFPILLMAQTGVEADEHAIRAVMDRFMDAWNHHDAEAFAAVFSQDADFTNVRGVGATGR